MCCGRNSVTSSPVASQRSGVQLRVGDNARPIKWKWRAIGTQTVDLDDPLLANAQVVSDSEIRFDTEDEFKVWIAAGHPGTKNVVAV